MRYEDFIKDTGIQKLEQAALQSKKEMLIIETLEEILNQCAKQLNSQGGFSIRSLDMTLQFCKKTIKYIFDYEIDPKVEEKEDFIVVSIPVMSNTMRIELKQRSKFTEEELHNFDKEYQKETDVKEMLEAMKELNKLVDDFKKIVNGSSNTRWRN